MPTINIFYSKQYQKQNLQNITKELKPFLAKKLTCGDIKLKENEISVRLVKVDGAGMIGAVEVEITAFVFPERVKRQDEICLEVREFIHKKCPQLGDIRVWLILTELGHSWE